MKLTIRTYARVRERLRAHRWHRHRDGPVRHRRPPLSARGPMTLLTAEGLVLRQWEDSDATALLDIYRDPASHALRHRESRTQTYRVVGFVQTQSRHSQRGLREQDHGP